MMYAIRDILCTEDKVLYVRNCRVQLVAWISLRLFLVWISRDEGMFWLRLQAKLGLYNKASHSVIIN
jgi:hypothetical protein